MFLEIKIKLEMEFIYTGGGLLGWMGLDSKWVFGGWTKITFQNSLNLSGVSSDGLIKIKNKQDNIQIYGVSLFSWKEDLREFF